MVMVRPNVGTFQVDCAGAQLANATSGVGRHGYANASLSPCGRGMGRGVNADASAATINTLAAFAPDEMIGVGEICLGRSGKAERLAVTPLPIPPPQGGREAFASRPSFVLATGWRFQVDCASRSESHALHFR